MADILVVAEVAEGKLKKTTHSAVTFARKAAAALGGTYSILVIGAASAYGKDLLARVAGRLGAGYASDISEVIAEGGALAYKRPMFAGNAYGIAKIGTPIQVVSVRQSAFSAAEPEGAAS